MGTTGALTPQQVTDLFSGLHYVNVHSTVNPGGEIRGQVYLVPEPAALSVIALSGTGGFLLWRRRRRW
jgi:hypothetical protein